MMKEEVKTQVSSKIIDILQEGINGANLETLGELIDIHKDLANEDYWKIKEVKYMMNYNRGAYNEGNYSNGGYGNYGRRGVPGTGRGRGRRYGNYGGPEESMEEIHEYLEEYMQGKEQMGRGNYGAKDESLESLDCMMQGLVEFIESLKKEVGSQEEMQIIQKYSKQISNM